MDIKKGESNINNKLKITQQLPLSMLRNEKDIKFI